MKVGDLVQSARYPRAIAVVLGFKEVYEGCGSKYPIIRWMDTLELDSCHHSHLRVVSESR